MFSNRIVPCFIACLIACCVLAVPRAASGAPLYNVHVLGPAGSMAYDINLRGQVVGRYINGNGDTRAFIHSGNGLLDLGTFGGSRAVARAINNSGVVVGEAYNAAGHDRAFSYAAGVMSDLGSFGGPVATAAGINRAGVIVGYATRPDQSGAAFRLTAGGLQALGALPGDGQYGQGLAVNASGQVAGVSGFGGYGPPNYPTHAFLYSNGVMRDLGTLGGWYSSGDAINDAGVVVGQASTRINPDRDPDPMGHTVPHAFIYLDGMMIDLGTLDEAASVSAAHDINNLGQVVGYSSTRNGNRAFLYQAGSMVDLNRLIDPGSGWTIEYAMAISDLQQIAGTGCRGGQCYAVRLDLVSEAPEPGAGMLMALALALLGWSTHRARPVHTPQ